jgi:polyketide cyclase/dehydrase/lipid transport protein
MNEWSEARVEPIAPGAGGRDDAPGARRRVTVRAFGLRAPLVETVVAAEPPRRFVYQVTQARALREHRGEIELTDGAAGCALLWTVRFRAALPGLAPLLAAILRPRLERSLAALERILG